MHDSDFVEHKGDEDEDLWYIKEIYPPPGGTFDHFDWENRNAIETNNTVVKVRNTLDS